MLVGLIPTGTQFGAAALGMLRGLATELRPRLGDGNGWILGIAKPSVDQLSYFRMEGKSTVLLVPPPPYALGCDDCDRESRPQRILLLVQRSVPMELVNDLEVIQVLNDPSKRRATVFDRGIALSGRSYVGAEHSWILELRDHGVLAVLDRNQFLAFLLSSILANLYGEICQGDKNGKGAQDFTHRTNRFPIHVTPPNGSAHDMHGPHQGFRREYTLGRQAARAAFSAPAETRRREVGTGSVDAASGSGVCYAAWFAERIAISAGPPERDRSSQMTISPGANSHSSPFASSVPGRIRN